LSFSQNTWDGDISKFIRIEVNYSALQSISLCKDGLICKSIDLNNNTSYLEFYKLENLNKESLIKLESFLMNNSIFYKDTIIYDSAKSISSYDFNFFIIKDYKSFRVIWRGSNNQILHNCLILLNNLIPEQKRKLFSITHE